MSGLVRVKRNPRSDAARKALDSVTYALSVNDIWVNEYRHAKGEVGTEYVWGLGRDAQVVACWDGLDGKAVQWVGTNELSAAQVGLIEAHADLFAAMM